MSAACSADGRTMIAAESAVYISTNSGTNWTQVGVPLSYPYVACSADGTRLAAAGYPGLIYFSEDSGATWTASNAGSSYWGAITCSSDGTAWLALDVGQGIIWRLQTTPRPLLGIAADGGNLVLSWPVSSLSFVLQQCSDFSSTNWFNAEGKPVLNPTNLHNEVILSPTNGSGFYRLAAP